MSDIKFKLIDILKTNPVGKPLYVRLKKLSYRSKFKIESLSSLTAVPQPGDEVRFNLVLPTLRKTKVYGGILTTIRILTSFMEQNGCAGRIIIINNEEYNPKMTYHVDGFSYDGNGKNKISYVGESRRIDVKKNDVFIYTNWRTAFLFMPVLKWQIGYYGLNNRKALYLIQDYEPGFFAWSTEYVLAESTYKTDSDKIIALFNSRELYDFFQAKQYTFAEDSFFKPSLNEQLKKRLLKNTGHRRKKQILIYGRPSEFRNAFEIIKGALRIWSENYPKAKEWKIRSLGEDFGNITLRNNVVQVNGKVSLDEYAEIMLSSYAGISLMISPHPSYPPLEMSTFGVWTITNTFENKDLSDFNGNIISVHNCTPEEIAKKLTDVCDGYGKNKTSINTDNDYIVGGHFDMVIEKMGALLYEMVNKD